MTEFKEVSTINTREELIDIWNYWMYKMKLLKRSNPENKEEIREIKSYIDQLSVRDKKLISLKRSIAAKERAARKAEDERKYQESVLIAREQVNADKLRKSKIQEEINNKNEQIKLLEIQLANYAKEIGLTLLKKQVDNLNKKLSKTIKPPCQHRNKSCGSLVYTGSFPHRNYNCHDCGHSWEEDMSF